MVCGYSHGLCFLNPSRRGRRSHRPVLPSSPAAQTNPRYSPYPGRSGRLIAITASQQSTNPRISTPTGEYSHHSWTPLPNTSTKPCCPSHPGRSGRLSAITASQQSTNPRISTPTGEYSHHSRTPLPNTSTKPRCPIHPGRSGRLTAITASQQSTNPPNTPSHPFTPP